MASYRVEEEDETKELEEEDQQRSIRIVNQNNMNHQRMMTMENDNGSVGIIGSLINMVRKCLLKRRGKNKNDKYEYEVNEYVEDTGYYNEYDVIFHDTVFYFLWNLIIVLLLIFTSFVYPMAFGFGIWNDTVTISLINVFIDLLFMMDVTINFCITFKQDGEIVTDRERIAKNYLHSWFVIDFIGAIPFTWFFFGLFKNADRTQRQTKTGRQISNPENCVRNR